MQEAMRKAAVLIEALPYIQEFKGSVVLVKVGGSVMEIPENLESLLTDIAFMNAVGIKTVLVHGGGKAISRGMDASGIVTQFLNGLRVTTEEAVHVVEQVIKHEVNRNVVGLLQKHGANARPLHGDWIFDVAKKTGIDPQTGVSLDWGYVGEPVTVDARPVIEMLDAGIVPVVTPLGTGPEGKLYNVNADTAAAALAKVMRVRKLAFISDVPGLLMDVDDPASLMVSLQIGRVRELKEAGVVGGGMLPKLDSCVEAIKAGVGKVHLIDGRMPHSLLLEVFTKKGVGTEIIADE